jgi:hypothetical protein
MKKNVLFVLFGATILLTMNACKTDELDLDKELKFSKLSVEEQKASIEQNGLDFVTAMEGMQDTKAMTTLMNMLEMTDGEIVYAPMQRLVSDIKNGRQKAFSNFDKQMRISYIDSEIWGEYSYNFTTEEMEQVSTLTNKLIFNFPATESATTNTAKITITYEESTVEIPDTEGELYPSKITFVMTVAGTEVLTANFSGKYYSDGAPQEVTQSLKMDTYEWTAEIKNDKKTASESYEFKNGKTTLLKSVAEVNGTLTETELTAAMEDESPENAISGFAVNFQVMDVAIKGGTTNFNGFMTEGKALDSEKLTDKQYADKTAEIFNKYMVCTAYFVDANRKFADVEFYTVEYIDEYGYWDYQQQKYIPQTYYDIAPRFILSDGSKVAVEDYVMEGFDEIINKIEDMENDFDY